MKGNLCSAIFSYQYIPCGQISVGVIIGVASEAGQQQHLLTTPTHTKLPTGEHSSWIQDRPFPGKHA